MEDAVRMTPRRRSTIPDNTACVETWRDVTLASGMRRQSAALVSRGWPLFRELHVVVQHVEGSQPPSCPAHQRRDQGDIEDIDVEGLRGAAFTPDDVDCFPGGRQFEIGDGDAGPGSGVGHGDGPADAPAGRD